jgi:hypothetical protein
MPNPFSPPRHHRKSVQFSLDAVDRGPFVPNECAFGSLMSSFNEERSAASTPCGQSRGGDDFVLNKASGRLADSDMPEAHPDVPFAEDGRSRLSPLGTRKARAFG